jgi:hypothetical protein
MGLRMPLGRLMFDMRLNPPPRWLDAVQRCDR